MSERALVHVNRPLTDEERLRHAAIRDAAAKDFPPSEASRQAPSPAGIPATIRQARESRQLTWYALAALAGIDNQATIRDIEQGKDAKTLRSRARGWRLLMLRFFGPHPPCADGE